MELYNTDQEAERLILIGIDNDTSPIGIEESLEELAALADTSGAITMDRLTQKRERPHPGHYFGKGKLDELKDLISLHNATGIVSDDELTNTQIRNLTDRLEVKVLDRTLLILDIFAKNASSAEGKAQVELAQQNYRLAHLSGLGKSLSRLGGGIGTRGPGEKKLETDRRHIRKRILELEAHLKLIQTHRKVLRDGRSKDSQIGISLVGYTNAGKSTLMNMLTSADVYMSEKLFATLDTTTRSFDLTGGSKVLVSDTVGFIHKLPHNLIKAFQATLDELKYADIILHVVDSANTARSQHMNVVYDTLKKLDCIDKPIITIFNKADLDIELPYPEDKFAVETLSLSAKTGEGREKLLTVVENTINDMRKHFIAVIPYSEGSLMNKIRLKSEILKEEYVEAGIYIEAYASDEIFNRIAEYRTE